VQNSEKKRKKKTSHQYMISRHQREKTRERKKTDTYWVTFRRIQISK
jgi:hypothetical protein